MTATALMERLESIGVRLEAADDRLRFFPAELVTDDLRQEMATHKSEILHLLQKPQEKELDRNEITWRIEAMRSQMPVRPPYPLLVAGKESQWEKGYCHSCGDALNPESLYRCGYCVSAIYLLFGLTEGAKPVLDRDVQGLNG